MAAGSRSQGETSKDTNCVQICTGSGSTAIKTHHDMLREQERTTNGQAETQESRSTDLEAEWESRRVSPAWQKSESDLADRHMVRGVSMEGGRREEDDRMRRAGGAGGNEQIEWRESPRTYLKQ